MSLEFGGYGVVGPLGVYDKGLIFYEDCEVWVAKWVAAGTGADYVHGITTAAAYNKAYGAQLQTRATNPAADDYVQITRSFPYPYRDKIWFRFRFKVPVMARLKTMKVEFNLYNGIKQRRAAMRYVAGDYAYEYLNGLGTWSALSALAMSIPENTWQEFTFAIDLTLNQYVEAYMSGKFANLKTIGFYEVGLNTTRQADVTIYIDAANENRPYIYFDDVMVGEHVAV